MTQRRFSPAVTGLVIGFVFAFALALYLNSARSASADTVQPATTTPPAPTQPAQPASSAPKTAPAPASARVEVAADVWLDPIVKHAVVKSYGTVTHRGDIDLTSTIRRILRKGSHPHRNDGSVFGNRERRLPKKPRGYYREYVHPTDGISGAGPQRIVVGGVADWYYTPDHYETFRDLRAAKKAGDAQ